MPDYSTEAIDYTPIMDSLEIEESSRTDEDALEAITPATSASSYSDYTPVDSFSSAACCRTLVTGSAVLSAIVMVVNYCI